MNMQLIIFYIIWFLIFCGKLICEEDNKNAIYKTVSPDLNIILENYKKQYYLINNKKAIYSDVSRYNTISIIDDYKNKIKNRIEKLDFFIEKDYIKKILKVYFLIKKIKENSDENYYEKILSHIGMNKDNNKKIQLNQNECKKILFLINSISSMSKLYFFNLNNTTWYKWLGDNQGILLREIDKYKSIYDLMIMEIKKSLKFKENINIKKILDDAIYFFDNVKNIYKDFKSKKDILIDEINKIDNQIKNQQNQKELIEKTNYVEEKPFKKLDHSEVIDLLNNNINKLIDARNKKKIELDIIEKLKKLTSDSIILKKNTDKTSWYNISKNIEIMNHGRKIINEINKVNLELEAIDSQFENNNWDNYYKIDEVNHNAIEIAKLLKELSYIIYEKKNIYSDDILNLIDKLTINIEYFKTNEDLLIEDKNNIDKIMNICEILKLIKRPSEKYKLTKNDLYCNYILYILFFSNNHQEEILKKITTVLQYIQIDMSHLNINTENIFSGILAMIQKNAAAMFDKIASIEKLLLNINSYISCSILLEMVDPKKSIEETFIYELYNIVFNRNKKNILLNKKYTVYNTPKSVNNNITLKGFGEFLFEKSKLFIKSMYLFFKRPSIEHISIMNNDDKKSISTEVSNFEDNSDIFSEINNDINLSQSQLNKIIEKENNNNKSNDEEFFYDIDESLWDKIIAKENSNIIK